MKNGDMPASPCSEEQTIITENGFVTTVYNEKQSFGLTKREHFAAMAIPPMEMIIEAMTEHSSPFTLDDYIVCAVSYKLKEADALLKALESEQ